MRDVSKSIEYFESLIAYDRDQLTMEQASSVLLEIARIHVSKDRNPESLVARCEDRPERQSVASLKPHELTNGFVTKQLAVVP